jgi:hypothetical protein
MKPFAAAVILVVPIFVGAQQQAARPRGNWPCGARIDPSYFQVAEGTGGHLLLLAPEEIGDSATLLTALGAHPQTLHRLAGSLTPGLHEFQVLVDPSVESVLFSISVQCLQVADILSPSGAAPSGDDVVDLSNFRAERMVIVKRPEPGVWTLRLSGSGVSGVVVQARSSIGITDVQFAPVRSTNFSPFPTTDVENVVKIRLRGRARELRGSLVSGVFLPVASLPLERDDTDGSYLSRFTPGPEGVRVLIAGKDDDGVAFQRMYAPLITPRR